LLEGSNPPRRVGFKPHAPVKIGCHSPLTVSVLDMVCKFAMQNGRMTSCLVLPTQYLLSRI
jgi:hypothetical protein